MSPIVELSVANPALFGDIFLDDPGIRISIEDVHYFREDGGSHYVLFWWVEGVGFDEFERRARAGRHVCELEEITSVADRQLYRLTTTPLPEEMMLFPFFRRHGITMLDGRASNDGLWLRLRVGDRESIRTLVEKIQGFDGHPSIERIYTEREREDVEPTLTDRQCEAIRRAFERGYFETPSEVTLAELAADLDITPQTLSKHIRTGVAKLVEESLSQPATDPGDEGVP